MQTLTPRQSVMLEAISAFVERKGYAPTVRELRGVLGLASTATVHAHLRALQAKGAISMDSNVSRTIRVLATQEVA